MFVCFTDLHTHDVMLGSSSLNTTHSAEKMTPKCQPRTLGVVVGTKLAFHVACNHIVVFFRAVKNVTVGK